MKTQLKLSDIRPLVDYFCENEDIRHYDKWRKIIKLDFIDSEKLNYLICSLNEGLLTVDEAINGEFLFDYNRYYSSDEYVFTYDSEIISKNEAIFCEYKEEWFPENECQRVYIGEDRLWYSDVAIERLRRNGDLFRYNREFYDNEALNYHDLVICQDTDNILNRDDAYFNENEGCYYEERPEEYVRDYHNDTNVHKVTFTENPKFFIGYEIEKEDQDVKESMLIDEFEESCPEWRKEKDGSLSDNKGYELVSPCFELNTDEIKKVISSDDVLMSHVNAKIDTDTCGGHINISEKGLTGKELFEKIEGYTPLFHALYYKRIDKNWSKAKSNKELKDCREKYQSVRIHSNRCEYRIISAVPNLDTLMWRTELFNIILNNPTSCVETAFYKCHTILKSHLEQMYSTPEKFDVLMSRVIKYTESYEGIVIDKTKTK